MGRAELEYENIIFGNYGGSIDYLQYWTGSKHLWEIIATPQQLNGSARPVVKVSRILSDLRSGAQKIGYRQIRGPINLSNAKDISAGSIRGAEIYRDPPPQVLYFNRCVRQFCSN